VPPHAACRPVQHPHWLGGLSGKFSAHSCTFVLKAPSAACPRPVRCCAAICLIPSCLSHRASFPVVQRPHARVQSSQRRLTMRHPLTADGDRAIKVRHRVPLRVAQCCVWRLPQRLQLRFSVPLHLKQAVSGDAYTAEGKGDRVFGGAYLAAAAMTEVEISIRQRTQQQSRIFLKRV